jgi:hypothetical protein
VPGGQGRRSARIARPSGQLRSFLRACDPFVARPRPAHKPCSLIAGTPARAILRHCPAPYSSIPARPGDRGKFWEWLNRLTRRHGASYHSHAMRRAAPAVAAGAPRQCAAAATPTHWHTCGPAGSLSSNRRPRHQQHVALCTRQMRTAARRLRPAGARQCPMLAGCSVCASPLPSCHGTAGECTGSGSPRLAAAAMLHTC